MPPGRGSRATLACGLLLLRLRAAIGFAWSGCMWMAVLWQPGRTSNCVTNLHEVVATGGFLDLPPLVQVPDGAIYGTCDIAARLLNQDAANCRLRVASMDSPSIVLSSTAQMGDHIIDDLEFCTNLDPAYWYAQPAATLWMPTLAFAALR
jgi:hypothetical protein